MFNRIPTQLKKYGETSEAYPRQHIEVKPSLGHHSDGINRIGIAQFDLHDIIKERKTQDIFDINAPAKVQINQKPFRDRKKSQALFQFDMKPEAQSLIKGVTDDEDLFSTKPKSRIEMRERSPLRLPIFNDKQNKSLSQNRSIYRVPIFQRDTSHGRSRLRRGLFQNNVYRPFKTENDRILSPKQSDIAPSHNCILKDKQKPHYVAPSLSEYRYSRWADIEKTVIMEPIKREPVNRSEKSPILFQRLMDYKPFVPGQYGAPSTNNQNVRTEAQNTIVNVAPTQKYTPQRVDVTPQRVDLFPPQPVQNQTVPIQTYQPVQNIQQNQPIFAQSPFQINPLLFQPINETQHQPTYQVQQNRYQPTQQMTKPIQVKPQIDNRQNNQTVATKPNLVNKVAVKMTQKNEKKGTFDMSLIPIIVVTAVSVVWLVLIFYDTFF